MLRVNAGRGQGQLPRGRAASAMDQQVDRRPAVFELSILVGSEESGVRMAYGVGSVRHVRSPCVGSGSVSDVGLRSGRLSGTIRSAL